MEKEMFDCLQLIITILIGLVAIVVASHIPHMVMLNQLYIGLIADYRKPEMGEAILAIFHFYKRICKEDINLIESKYKKIYRRQIRKKLYKKIKNIQSCDFSHTLHFQRRMVAQFYFNLAILRNNRFCPKSLKKEMRMWFTQNDKTLLSLLLHMAKPARDVFEEVKELTKPPQDEVYMNKLLIKLRDEVDKLA